MKSTKHKALNTEVQRQSAQAQNKLEILSSKSKTNSKSKIQNSKY